MSDFDTFPVTMSNHDFVQNIGAPDQEQNKMFGDFESSLQTLANDFTPGIMLLEFQLPYSASANMNNNNNNNSGSNNSTNNAHNNNAPTQPNAMSPINLAAATLASTNDMNFHLFSFGNGQPDGTHLAGEGNNAGIGSMHRSAAVLASSNPDALNNKAAYASSFGPVYQGDFMPSAPSPAFQLAPSMNSNPALNTMENKHFGAVSQDELATDYQISLPHAQNSHLYNSPDNSSVHNQRQIATGQVISTTVPYSHEFQPPILSAASGASFDQGINLMSSPGYMAMGFLGDDDFNPPHSIPPDNFHSITTSSAPHSSALHDSSLQDFLPYSYSLPSSAKQHEQQRRYSYQPHSAPSFYHPQSQPSHLHQQQRQRQQNLRALQGSPKHETQHHLIASTPSVSSLTPEVASANLILASSNQQHLAKEQRSPRSKSPFRKFRLVRGISSGGSVARPPKVSDPSMKISYVPVNLKLINAKIRDLCLPEWDAEEKADKRRIIRIERRQSRGNVSATFSIVGSAQANPKSTPAPPGADVVEVSCLKCYARPGDDSDDEQSGNDSDAGSESGDHNNLQNGSANSSASTTKSSELVKNFYITSVEVIRIVELLIGTESQQAAEKRRERGRIRSNLVPFWSKKPISTRKNSTYTTATSRRSPSNSPYMSNGDLGVDFRIELAKRIMGYATRKPRGFDKDVRILKWEKLEHALKRALQSYYVEIPEN